jgi:proline racemase
MSLADPREIEVVDSHTEGEPTRVVIGGWPEVEGESMAERREFLARNHDHLRRGVVMEPRGHEAIVGALLLPPTQEASHAGVVFFNDVGYLGMCGHGLMGLARTLALLGMSPADRLVVDTPVGTVEARFLEGSEVEIANVSPRVHATDVTMEVPGIGRVVGDVVYGGNWFFLTTLPGEALEFQNRDRLLEAARRIRAQLVHEGLTGEDGAPIDHVEFSGPPSRPDAHSKNFVLCPGRAYDRSPCGTGTSAKLGLLHAKGLLEVGQEYRQESITGSLFAGRLEAAGGQLVPHLRGAAHITGRSVLRFDPADPYRWGLGS